MSLDSTDIRSWSRRERRETAVEILRQVMDRAERFEKELHQIITSDEILDIYKLLALSPLTEKEWADIDAQVAAAVEQMEGWEPRRAP